MEGDDFLQLPSQRFVTQRTVKIGGTSAGQPGITVKKALHQEILEAVEHSVLTRSGPKQRVSYSSPQLRRELQKGNLMAELPPEEEDLASDSDQAEDMEDTSTGEVPDRGRPDETTGAAAAGAAGQDPNQSLSAVDKLTLMFTDFVACHSQSIRNQDLSERLLKEYRQMKIANLEAERKEKEAF